MSDYKEYLVPDNGGYRVAVQDAGLPIAEDWIEIPEGAEKATFCRGFFAFWKDGATQFAGEDSEWDFDYNLDCSGYLRTLKDHGAKIIWQRATHPEELPFVDDEPKSLNDQYAEIEQVRQASKDNVNHPGHYADSAIECIDAMEAMMTPEQFIGYLRGNLFKYQWRYEKKNGIEDLKKAQWYLEKLTVKIAEKNAPF